MNNEFQVPYTWKMNTWLQFIEHIIIVRYFSSTMLCMLFLRNESLGISFIKNLDHKNHNVIREIDSCGINYLRIESI